MNTRQFTRSLEPEDWLLIGYLIGFGIWWLSEQLSSSATASTSQPARRDGVQRVGGYDEVHLGEQALERIERGETVEVERWHGGTVTLQGDLVVELEETEDEATE